MLSMMIGQTEKGLLEKYPSPEGELKKRGTFTGEIVMSKVHESSNSLLVAMVTSNDNIVKSL